MSKFPLWATPDRRDWLVELFTQSRGLCIWGHGSNCPDLLADCYQVMSEDLITTWKADDRAERAGAWKREQRRLHATPRITKRGPFDTIAREEYLAHRPLFRVVGLGVGAFTFKRVALVEIPALRASIFVDLTGIAISRNKLRKLFRHGKGGCPTELYDRIQHEVRRYLSG